MVAGEYVDVKPGNAMPLANIPVGTIIHNIELKVGKGGQIARSAGTYAQIVGRDGAYVILRLNSGEQRLVHGRCIATIGAVSNPDNMNISIGKAGRTRWMGRRGQRRGEADESRWIIRSAGRTRGGRHPVTPWGKPTKGRKTRKNKATAKFIMLSRHARKKKSECDGNRSSFRHPEVLGAQRRASKGDGPGSSAAHLLEGSLRSHLRMTVSRPACQLKG